MTAYNTPLQSSLLYSETVLAELDKNDRYTPACIIEAARTTLDAIDLDPASSTVAQQVVQATRYYTRTEDGLRQPWRGRVWLNPPFDDPTPWIDKLLSHYVAHEVQAALLLLRCDMGTEDHRKLHGPVCTLRRSVANFWRPDEARSAANQSHVVYLIGGDLSRFVAAFRPLGQVRGEVL